MIRERAAVSRVRTPILVVAAALLALAGVLSIASLAQAHGALRQSAPASGATLTVAPRELRLTFTEASELAVSRIELLGPGDAAVGLGPLRYGDSTTVLVADITGALEAGTYSVAWQIVGRDGHPVRGRYRFTIAAGATGLGAPAAPPARTDSVAAAETQAATHPAEHPEPETAPAAGQFDAGSPLYAAVRWLGFAAMLGVIGTVGFGVWVLPSVHRRLTVPAPVAEGEVFHRMRTVGMLAAATLLLAAGLRLVAQSVATNGAAAAFDSGGLAAIVGGTLWGTALKAQVAAALLALAGFWLLSRRRAAGWLIGTAAAVAIAVSAALSGHAAGVPGRAGLAVAADAVHVLAAGGWLGTLLVLAAAGLPVVLHASPRDRGGAAAVMAGAFSPLALTCAAVLALTGVVSGWLHLGSLGALGSSTYGRTLLVKLALVALVAGAGAYNWRRVRPALVDAEGAERLWRSVRVELAIGVLVLVVTAVLVATPTPMDVLR